VSFGLGQNDSRAVGGGFAADRLLMAMLRAVAGVVMVGAGTLRATLNHQWTPEALAPDRAADLAELRAAVGLPETPAPLLVVSSSGRIPAEADAVARPATALHVLLPGGLFDAGHPALWSPAAQAAAGVVIDPAEVVAAALGLGGGGPVLCEGGPHLLGSLLLGGVPLDLFLSVAPQLAGRVGETNERRSLVEGVALPPFARAGTLRSIRRAGDNLLLRYAIDAAQPS
jgi:riboflavin biosynthesis pyrimidine reductase